MQNSNKTYNYNIGGVHFRLEAPEFGESQTLAIFAEPASSADVSYRISFAEKPEAPEGMPVYRETLREYYAQKGGLCTVFLDEHDDSVLLTDVPAASMLPVDASADASGSPAGTCCRKISLRESVREVLGTNLILKIMDIPRKIIDFDGIFLHASYVDAGGEALLFTGPKQIGKSTHAALWEKYRGAEVVNGDRVLLRKKEGRWHAFGSPYCGTSDICKNRTLPVKAIVIIDGDLPVPVQKAGVRRALGALLDGCSYDTWNKEQMTKVTDICSNIISEIPFYVLKRVADESAVRALEEVL